MKKTMIILMMLTISSTSFANTICKENYLVVNGFSHHFAKKTRYARENGYNEVNYGLGYKCQLENLGSFNQDAEFGYLKNSYRADSFYISYSILKPISEDFSLGLRASINSGYEMLESSHHGLFGGVAPTIQYNITNNIKSNLALAPNFLFLNFQYKF